MPKFNRPFIQMTSPVDKNDNSSYFKALLKDRVSMWGIRNSATVLILLVGFARLHATILRVPQQFPTIQQAITAASDHDTLLIRAGTYSGDGNRDIQIVDKIVDIVGVGGPDSVRIDCQGTLAQPHRAFTFNAYGDSTWFVEGIGIENGYAGLGGAVNGSIPIGNLTIRNCIFRNNYADSGGAVAAILGRGFAPLFVDCVFEGNSANGGGVASQLTARFHNCTFLNNHAVAGGVINSPYWFSDISGCTFLNNRATYGGAIAQMPHSTISNCLFARQDSAILFYDVDADIDHCTFFRNAEIAYLFPWDHPTFNSCLFAFTTAQIADCPIGNDISQIGTLHLQNCDVFDSPIYYPWCIISDYPQAYIEVDPHFCDTTGTDFSVAANSACIGQGSNGTNIGAFGAGCSATDVEGRNGHNPLTFSLSQNYPNPFNPSTTISFDLPRREAVKLTVFDVTGRVVRSLLNKQLAAGTHRVTWDGRNEAGKSVASGVYLFRLSTPDFQQTVKGTLLK